MKILTFQLAKPAVEAHLRVLNPKHTVREAAFLHRLNPAFSQVLHTAVKQDAEFARNKRDDVGKIVGKEYDHNIKKLLNQANVVFVNGCVVN